MEIVLINSLGILYLVVSIYQAYKYKNSMSESAYHHFLSHIFIVASAVVSSNLYVYECYITPIIFTILYIMQHVYKENNRLLQTNRWTPTVEEN